MDEIIFWIKQSWNSRIDKLKSYQAEQIQIKTLGCITCRQEADLGVLPYLRWRYLQQKLMTENFPLLSQRTLL